MNDPWKGTNRAVVHQRSGKPFLDNSWNSPLSRDALGKGPSHALVLQVPTWLFVAGIAVIAMASMAVEAEGWGWPGMVENNATANATAPAVAMNPDGDSIVVWAMSNSTADHIWAARCPAGGDWGDPIIIQTDASKPG